MEVLLLRCTASPFNSHSFSHPQTVVWCLQCAALTPRGGFVGLLLVLILSVLCELRNARVARGNGLQDTPRASSNPPHPGVGCPWWTSAVGRTSSPAFALGPFRRDLGTWQILTHQIRMRVPNTETCGKQGARATLPRLQEPS